MAIFSFIFVLSCGGQVKKTTPPKVPTYNAAKYVDALTEHKYKVTLRLTALCPEGMYIGSAVIVGPDLVYTAKHVAECRRGDALVIVGKRSDGAEVLLEIGDKSENFDVVTLKAVSWMTPPPKEGKAPEGDDAIDAIKGVNFEEYAVASPRDPRIGEELCFVGGGGDRELFLEKCGKVFLNSKTGFGVSILGVGGNSGGPIFDKHGAVLGIVSMRNLTDTATYIVSVKHVPGVMTKKSDQSVEAPAAP